MGGLALCIRKWERMNTMVRFKSSIEAATFFTAWRMEAPTPSKRKINANRLGVQEAFYIQCIQNPLGKAGQQEMKATGIVRRIDDLGRVVIPKEIRRTLRIREGDPLEIFVDRDGEVILKKYSPIGELGDFAKEYAESLFESTGHMTLISDRDTIITVAGASKKELMDKPIGATLENCMDSRKTVSETGGGSYEIVKDVQDTFSSFVAAPIIAGGDPIGTVVLLSKDEAVKMAQMETKMAETAAGFLAKQMEQ